MNNNYYTSVDTTVLKQNFHHQIFEKTRKWGAVNTDPYVCKREGGDSNLSLGLSFRHKDCEKRFLHIELKKNDYEHSGEPLINSTFTIHLNHFMEQAFPNSEFVSPDDIIQELEWIIRRYLRFPSFKLDRMNISYLDIAMDYKVEHDPFNYLQVLKHKRLPRYILHPNEGRGTLSIHSYKYAKNIDDIEDTPNRGTIYNKSKKMGLDCNILRFEFRLQGNQKNEVELIENGYLLLDSEKGITKFSDIFNADINSELKKRFIDGVLYKDNDVYNQLRSADNYETKHREWVNSFSNESDYYLRLEPLQYERDQITDRIKSERFDWARKQLTKEHSDKVLDELWDDIEANLINKFKEQLNELGNPIEDTLKQLRNVFNEKSLIGFVKHVRRTVPLKEKKRVDQAHESTRKVIIKYFEKRYNVLFEDEIKERKREVSNAISTLNSNYKTYKQYKFLIVLDKGYACGVNGHTLFNELLDISDSFSSHFNEKVFNLYRYYRSFALKKAS